MKRLMNGSCILVSILLLSFPLHAQKNEKDYAGYVEQLKSEAISEGFDAQFVNQAFADITLYKRAIKADKNQPESKITLDKYLRTRVPDWKVQQAIDLYRKHQQILNKIGKEYGVQPRFIVALWGNESNFGKIMGNYSVISALSTLAYEGRRESFFKKQLFAALTILQQGHIQKQQFVGSWAGAMGQSQFIPSSFLTYAVDYDKDGKKDIWGNPADVFASIANYLSKEGWDDSITWGRQVRIPKGFDLALAGLTKSKMQSLSAWQALGVRRYDGSDLPKVDLQASLIMPDDENGRIYLVYSNFHTLMRWNRSTYFGSAVSYLADRIKKGS
ncbi:lytic murein transglycosylase [Aliiglaciecola sp. 2_MG-2023]|uniref:lytic murein transglycosylase n=1 Tax=unclassified Aliiglaciecola TaxID=2593648 RepID=UPI0026E1EC92|nr:MULTISPECIES: lytic murein transglycosylase [unclassified Aliiglaciecola]MDO6710929.1 lytic murein transglycosylase [Aliiglaciecola sp. 2_MG-2023]MDO6752410.1 lytic murein transglycosylase [Aliiglaciecola sp. 1_MG-2023]